MFVFVIEVVLAIGWSRIGETDILKLVQFRIPPKQYDPNCIKMLYMSNGCCRSNCSLNVDECLTVIIDDPIVTTNPRDFHTEMMYFVMSAYNTQPRGSILNQTTAFERIVCERFDISHANYEHFINKSRLTFTSMTKYDLSTPMEAALAIIDARQPELSLDLAQYLNINATDREHFEHITTQLNDKYNNSEYYPFRSFVAMVLGVAQSSRELLYEKRYGDFPSRASIWQADVSGAVIGGSWGAVTGSFAGGIGALPGGLLGGMIGSSYGSAAAGFWSLW